VQSAFVIILAPVFAWIWIRLGRHNPSVPTKIALGVMFMGIGYLVMAPAGVYAQSAPGVRVSPLWLVLFYLLSELGELCLYPVGLSAVTKLSPPRIVGVMMGVWFLSIAFGNKLAGYAAGFFSSMPLQQLFINVAVALLITAAVMFILVKPTKRLMSGVH
jgi:POT family proton-dependent oligopeptide transporter